MSNNWRNGVRLHHEDFVDSFVVKGAKQSDVYDAVVEEIGNLSAIPILRKIFQEQRLKSHRTNGRALCLEGNKKAGAKPHRPFQHRSSHQCQYIRGQKQISDFGSREHSRGALTSNADEL
ncbi:hypothetical protein A4U53_039070 (plasmid) [Rhizobium ruizarguesonis]|uniref:Uncharacterized protein n=1 Tax=Rhizobium ruizarguesonis TaxID=2081791 RepID=A0ACD5EX21_9HYPH